MHSIRSFNRAYRTRGLSKIRTFTDNRGYKHEFVVERVTSARRLARLFETVGFRTEHIRHEGLFPNVGKRCERPTLTSA